MSTRKRNMRKYKERLKMSLDIRQVTVTHIIPSGHGIGRCMRSLEEVFIPKSMVVNSKINVNDLVFIEVNEVPKEEMQSLDAQRKMWSNLRARAVYDKNSPFIHLLEEYKATGKININKKKDDKKLIDWNEAILKVLKDGDNFMTTRNVLDVLQGEYKLDCGGKDIGNKLSSLHRVGKVARLALSIDGGNKRVSEVCWCLSDIAAELYKNNVFGIFEDEEENVQHL